jgi:hypothetical protein|tara:strand:- start:863 stop:1453 length:591 start_codon:yes stop_codon:yes gene_type:complete
MVEIPELPPKDDPTYKEKLSEKRRVLMQITRNKKKENADVKKESYRQQIEANKIERAKDREDFKAWKKNKNKIEEKVNEDIVNEDNEVEIEEEEEEVEEVKPKKVIKPKAVKSKPKVKKQVIIEESESESEEEEEEVIIVKKTREKKPPKPKVIYVEKKPKPPPIRRQKTIIEEETSPSLSPLPERIDYSKYFTLR